MISLVRIVAERILNGTDYRGKFFPRSTIAPKHDKQP
jgi:hypothetical protein